MQNKILAFHLDLKRAMWSEEYMRRFAEILAGWGYNAVLYEVEDKLHFRKHPALAHADALGHAQTLSRLNALRKLGFEVIPLMQSLGHAEFVLTKPGYERFRESPAHTSQFDPLSEEARALICELIDEVIEAARPERYFHIGGDETWDLGKSEKCKRLAVEIGVGGIYLRHMRPIVEHVLRRGLRPVIWADMILTHPEIIADFPREAVMMDWDYWTGAARPFGLMVWGKGIMSWRELSSTDMPEFQRLLGQYAVDERTPADGTFRAFPYTDALREHGFEVMTAPAARSCGDTMGVPRNSVHLPNCFEAARKARDSALGCCVTSWAVRHNHPELSLPAAFAAAQAFSGADEFGAAAPAREFAERHFGVEMPEFCAAMAAAELSVPWSESREIFAEGAPREKVERRLRELKKTPEKAEAAAAETKKALTACREAEAAFKEMRKKAGRNGEHLDFWAEGAAHVAFCAEFALAALEGNLEKESERLAALLTALRSRTRALFAGTYPERSLDEELAMRYGFHETILRGRSSIAP